MRKQIRKVVVVGGGTAGWMSAALLRRVLGTADLQELIAAANALVPDLFRRRAEWLATHQPVNELVKNTSPH